MAIIVFLPDIKQALLWWHSVDDVHLCTLFFSEFFILFGGPFPNVNKSYLFIATHKYDVLHSTVYCRHGYTALKRQNTATTFFDTSTYLCHPKVKIACMILGVKRLPQEQIYNQCNISYMPFLHLADQL